MSADYLHYRYFKISHRGELLLQFIVNERYQKGSNRDEI